MRALLHGFSARAWATSSGLIPVVAAVAVLAAPASAAETSRATLDAMIAQHARANGVPAALVHRVVKRESNYNPRASSHGNLGLMQIRHGTARGLGYRGGAEGLLDPGTNLRYAVTYLAGAYMVAGGDHDRAVALYARGYYYEAKRKGLAGRLGGAPVEAPVELAPTPEQRSWIAALFGAGATPSPKAAEAQASPPLAGAEPGPSEGVAALERAPMPKSRRKGSQSARPPKPGDTGPRLADGVAMPGRS